MGDARFRALFVLLAGALSMAGKSRAQELLLAIDESTSSARVRVHLRIPLPADARLAGVTGQLRGSVASGWTVLVEANARGLHFAGPRWMDRITRSDSFLAVDRHPRIRFASGRFTDQVLRDGGMVAGELTLRGLTRPVSFRLLPSACGQQLRQSVSSADQDAGHPTACDIHVQGTISRHAFGMNAHRAIVKDAVDFHMDVRLKAGTTAK